MGLLLKTLAVAAATLIAASALADVPMPSPALIAKGKTTYEGAGCAACHGVTGEGNGPVAFALKPPPRNLVKDPFKGGEALEQVFATITNGLANTKMVGYPKLEELDRWAIAYYIVLVFRAPSKPK